MSSRSRTKRGRKARRRAAAAPAVLALGRRHAWILLGLTIAGFTVSVYLMYVHYRLHADPGWQSACDIASELSCDVVVLSPYGSVAGKPLSLFGAWFYLVSAAVVLSTFRQPRWRFPRSPAAVLFVGGVLATALSVCLAVISVVAIGAACPLCLVLYATNLGIAVTGWHAVRRSGEGIIAAVVAEHTCWKRKPGTALGALALAFAGLGAGTTAYSDSAGASRICEAVAEAARSGNTLELVLYSDFQCPHCRALDQTLRPILAEAGGWLRFTPGHFPLDANCNPKVKHSRHRGACRQAIAAICADQQGREGDYSERLFHEQRARDDELVELAVSLGLEQSRFEACLNSDEADEALRDSVSAAIARGVRATPTLFVNDVKQVGRPDDAGLRCLARAASRRPARKN